MAQVQGVGQGKAKKYGQDFINAIKEYVDENEIDRPQDIVVRTVANTKSNKIYIIQSLDKKLWIDDIAKGKGISREELAWQMHTTIEKVIEIENKGMDNSVWDIFYYFDGLGCWFNIQIEHDRKKINLGLGNAQESDELT